MEHMQDVDAKAPEQDNHAAHLDAPCRGSGTAARNIEQAQEQFGKGRPLFEIRRHSPCRRRERRRLIKGDAERMNQAAVKPRPEQVERNQRANEKNTVA